MRTDNECIPLCKCDKNNERKGLCYYVFVISAKTLMNA